MAFELDYDKMTMLDAEDLAEQGIKTGYDALATNLAQYVSAPLKVEETVDDAAPRYVVRSGSAEYVIFSPELPDDEGQSWARATYAFFKIVNDQLASSSSSYRFYAINGGNDLGGMFLTERECEAARRSLSRKTDWPYLPTLDPPWYGMLRS